LVVTDSQEVYDGVSSAIGGETTRLGWARSGRAVLSSLKEQPADLVVTDLQIGSMGGFAIAMDVALEAGAGRLSPTPVLVLLDRRADVFLARRTGVAGWLVKPLDPLRVRDAVAVVLAGERYEDTAFVSLPTDLGPGDEI
jgi:DNA-binding response OmpR family regulator